VSPTSTNSEALAEPDRLRWRRQFFLFAGAACFLGLTGGIFETTFNNFLNDVFHISARARGALEFPRELPGFLVAVFAGALFFVSEVRLAALTALMTSLGLWGLSSMGNHYPMMLVSMVVWSMGIHLSMPVQGSIALDLAGGNRAGTMLGTIGGYSTFAVIAGCGIVWLGREYLRLSYFALFAVAAASAALASCLLVRMQPISSSDKPRAKFVWRRAYGLYYILSMLFGMRKQVFITFGPLVLIKVFGQPVETIAKLWIVASILGIAFKPLLGWMIDQLGERFVLMGDALLLIGVCLGYGVGRKLLPMPYSLLLAYCCFVLDMMLFAMEMARSTYLDKIALTREDLAPSLSMGVSINHVASMSVPTLGGFIWAAFGYQWVFVGAAGVALITLIASSLIRVPPGRAAMAEADLVQEKVY
jgi:predicted MFS family arabinose efflux permease